MKCCFKVGLAVGVTVCLLRRRKMAKKREKEEKKGEEEGAEEDMGNFERISLE